MSKIDLRKELEAIQAKFDAYHALYKSEYDQEKKELYRQLAYEALDFCGFITSLL